MSSLRKTREHGTAKLEENLVLDWQDIGLSGRKTINLIFQGLMASQTYLRPRKKVQCNLRQAITRVIPNLDSNKNVYICQIESTFRI